MATVAVIGLGAMGGQIARRLLEAGHVVHVWNRSPERMTRLVDHGAAPAGSPAEAARRAEAVITMISGPAALADVTEGPEGIAAGSDGATTVIEMSTVGPAAVERLASALPEATGLLDAPVLGSLRQVESGSLRVFVGGPTTLVERWIPLLSDLGTPLHVGPLGSGAAAKLVANLTLLGTLGLLGETLALAQSLGLGPDLVFEVLAATPLAAQADRRRHAVTSGEYPLHFSLALARKDADLIVEAAERAGLDPRIASAVQRWFADAENAGWEEQDYSSVLAWMLGKDRPAVASPA